MIDLKLTEAQFDEFHKAASENPRARARRQCWVVYYLRGKGYACGEIADVGRVDADTVTAYARQYGDRAESRPVIGGQEGRLMTPLGQLADLPHPQSVAQAGAAFGQLQGDPLARGAGDRGV
ncbi:MAG: hypothetical protein LUO80_03265 [Methylococcaceae bacterium]|nr:hypothetical protein [Methylococcaceae bacterium]